MALCSNADSNTLYGYKVLAPEYLFIAVTLSKTFLHHWVCIPHLEHILIWHRQVMRFGTKMRRQFSSNTGMMPCCTILCFPGNWNLHEEAVGAVPPLIDCKLLPLDAGGQGRLQQNSSYMVWLLLPFKDILVQAASFPFILANIPSVDKVNLAHNSILNLNY